MSAQRGRDMLVKLKKTNGAFITIAGLRTKSLRLNARSVDITNTDSAEAWRELLPGAGVKSAEISGAGVFRDAQSDALARTAFFEQSLETYQFIIPDFGIIEGLFQISTLSFSGAFNGEARYEIVLSSAGAPRFTVLN